MGNKYGLSAHKLLFNNPSETDLKKAQHHQVDDDRTFFCSELIAKAFKVLNVLKDPKKGSNNYYPSSFDLGQSIDQDLKEEVAMGPPLNILVNGEEELDKHSSLHCIRTYRPSPVPLLGPQEPQEQS